MSYRTLKRLLGETSLERKCRLLLGGGIFVLIMVSFGLYWYQTEKLVWEQTEVAAQSLVQPVLMQKHWAALTADLPDGNTDVAPVSRRDWPENLEELLPEDEQRNYEARLWRPYTDALEYKHLSLSELTALQTLEKPDHPAAVTQIHKKQQIFQYMAPIRIAESCTGCHPTAHDVKLGYNHAAMVNGDLHSAIVLTLSLREPEVALNVNRALLISFALGTAIAAMVLAYVIVRYVIVKPVAHLKEVSEEIAAGNIDIRSNIQTGDEFQELSLAFNRMLRSLVSMQDQLRQVNTDLDNRLDELAQANMALFEMNRLKSEFLATISHELRTPLNSILGFSDVLAEIDTLNEKQRRWVENIRSSGKSLLTMIDDILNLAKLEAGKMQVHVEKFSLRDVIEERIQMTRPLADQKNIALEASVDHIIPILQQDCGKLQQIIANLLSNAIKFTPEGGRIMVTCKPDRADVVISVIDNGVGIAAEDEALIFEKFRQAESGLTRGHGGTGLGLSIVRELTKLLGGDDVHLESELGRGSTFTIRIPMHFDKQQTSQLSLVDETLEFAADRKNEVRYYISKDNPVRAEIG